MKIRRLSHSDVNSQSGNRVQVRFADDVQLLFGYLDASTSKVRESIRDILFGNPKGLSNSDDSIEAELANGIATLKRDDAGLDFSDANTQRSFLQTTREIDHFTYSSFFDVNFGDGLTTGSHLSRLLQQRFKVPVGDASKDRTRYRSMEKVTELREHLSRCVNELDQLSLSRSQVRSELDNLVQDQQPIEFERSRKSVLENRVATLQTQLEDLRIRAYDLERDIEQTAANQAPKRLVSSPGESRESLEQLDRQINRWKSVQADIDDRVKDLKVDLSSSRVDEFDSAFDEVRSILRNAEGRVAEIEDDQSTQPHVKQELNNIQGLHHQLCDAISDIQSSWRQHLVNCEIQDLNRCSSELNHYIDQLTSRQKRLSRSNPKSVGGQFCECKYHSVDRLSYDSHDLAEQKRQLEALLTEIDATSRMLNTTISELHSIKVDNDDATRKRIEELQNRLASLQKSIDNENVRCEKIERELELEESLPLPTASRILQMASSYIQEFTGRSLNRIFLADDRQDVILVSADQIQCSVDSSDLATRVQTRLAVSLAVAHLLAEKGYCLPLVLEDAFVGFSRADVQRACQVFRDFSESGIQVILLTNSETVRDYYQSQNLPCLDLPDRYSGEPLPQIPTEDQPFQTDRYQVQTDLTLTNRNLNSESERLSNQSQVVSSTDPNCVDSGSISSRRSSERSSENKSRQTEIDSSDSARTQLSRTSESRSEHSSNQNDSTVRFSNRSQDSEYRARHFDRQESEESNRERQDSSQRNQHRSSRSSSDRSRTDRSNSNRSSQRNRQSRHENNYQREDRRFYEREERDSRSHSNHSNQNSSRSNQSTESRSTIQSSASHSETRYYLELTDNVEKAPAIGARTAERLEAIGIVTVSDLVETDQEWICNELDYKRIKLQDIENWQHQAMLVCQVPHLRGHDAQILVACEVYTAEDLATWSPAELLELVGPFSQTKDGQKLLRGSSEPDLEEVTNWIRWAGQSRRLDQAA